MLKPRIIPTITEWKKRQTIFDHVDAFSDKGVKVVTIVQYFYFNIETFEFGDTFYVVKSLRAGLKSLQENEYETLEKAKNAVENEILSFNRKIKIKKILK